MTKKKIIIYIVSLLFLTGLMWFFKPDTYMNYYNPYLPSHCECFGFEQKFENAPKANICYGKYHECSYEGRWMESPMKIYYNALDRVKKNYR